MSQLAENLAAAWADRADREAEVSRLRGAAFTKPEEYERSEADHRTAVAWWRYWTGTGA